MVRSKRRSGGEATLAGLKAIQPKRLYQQIAEQIESYIVSGNLAVGDRLPAERELAVQFGVSRPSVREAMIALEGAGLIEVRTGDGTFVRRLVPIGTPLPLGTDLASNPEPGVLEQFIARRIIEPELAYLATSKIGPAEIARLEKAVNEAEERFSRNEFADDADAAFHVQLAQFSQNNILADLVERLWEMRNSDTWRTIRARVGLPEHRIEVIRRRREIISALRENDADKVRSAMFMLISRAIERYFSEG